MLIRIQGLVGRTTPVSTSAGSAVQVKGFGFLLRAWMRSGMTFSRDSTFRNVPRRIRLTAISRNQRSMMFSDELDVGVKCL
ncbi:MAG: hypothetical protein EDS66_05225 [Planctomycetota bacterium]|nr:MAG: hypothetical protein EDS66_05225 [Planctomycetota bacterium]MCQ3920904.1 hypothetical protein [Planctomycetota bacterium]